MEPKRLLHWPTTSIVTSNQLGQAQGNAPIRSEAANCVASQWQCNATFEPTLRQLKPVDPSVTEFWRQHSPTCDDKRSIIDDGFDLIWINPGQSYENKQLAIGLQHIDGRLPAGFAAAGPRLQIQELLVQTLGAGECLDSVGQHPVDGIFGRHPVSPVAFSSYKGSRLRISHDEVKG